MPLKESSCCKRPSIFMLVLRAVGLASISVALDGSVACADGGAEHTVVRAEDCRIDVVRLRGVDDVVTLTGEAGHVKPRMAAAFLEQAGTLWSLLDELVYGAKRIGVADLLVACDEAGLAGPAPVTLAEMAG